MNIDTLEASAILREWANDPKAHPDAAGRLSAMLPDKSRPIMFAHQGIQPLINITEALLWLGMDAAQRGDARRALAVAGLIENTPDDPLWCARLIAAVRREKSADDEHFSAMNIESRRPDGNLQRFAHLPDRTDETRIALAAVRAEIDRLVDEAVGGGNQAAPAGDALGADDLLPVTFYTKATKQSLTSGAMREAHNDGHIVGEKPGKRWLYSLSSVLRNPNWVIHHAAIERESQRQTHTQTHTIPH